MHWVSTVFVVVVAGVYPLLFVQLALCTPNVSVCHATAPNHLLQLVLLGLERSFAGSHLSGAHRASACYSQHMLHPLLQCAPTHLPASTLRARQCQPDLRLHHCPSQT